MALYLDVGPDDTLHVRGGDAVITIERKSGSRARLRIDGAADIELVKNGRQLPNKAPVVVGVEA